MKLLIRVEAGISSTPNGDEQVFAKNADGLQSDEIFAEYIDKGYPELYAANIKGGVLTLRYEEQTEQLWSNVEYEVGDRLSPTQEAALIEYTIQQLVDGIGDNLSQEYDDRTGVFIRFASSIRNPQLRYESI